MSVFALKARNRFPCLSMSPRNHKLQGVAQGCAELQRQSVWKTQQREDGGKRVAETHGNCYRQNTTSWYWIVLQDLQKAPPSETHRSLITTRVNWRRSSPSFEGTCGSNLLARRSTDLGKSGFLMVSPQNVVIFHFSVNLLEGTLWQAQRPHGLKSRIDHHSSTVRLLNV